MISQRYMVTAVPVDGNDRVAGYLVGLNVDIDAAWIRDPDSADFKQATMCDLSTVEPVKVKPMYKPTYNGGGKLLADFPHCPNCGSILDTFRRPAFCSKKNCGMGIDWE